MFNDPLHAMHAMRLDLSGMLQHSMSGCGCAGYMQAQAGGLTPGKQACFLKSSTEIDHTPAGHLRLLTVCSAISC